MLMPSENIPEDPVATAIEPIHRNSALPTKTLVVHAVTRGDGPSAVVQQSAKDTARKVHGVLTEVNGSSKTSGSAIRKGTC